MSTIQSTNKLEKIKELVAFYAANPTVPCTFEYARQMGKSNKVGVTPQTQQNVPAWMELTIEGDYKKVVYDGAKNLYGPHPHLFDKDTGDLRKRVEIKPISFSNFRQGIRGDSAENLKLIEYLLLLDKYKDGKIVKHIAHEAQHNDAVAGPLTGYELAKMVDAMLEHEDGVSFLLKRAKDGTLGTDADTVDAMFSVKGKSAVGDILKGVALTNPTTFKKGLNDIYKAKKELFDAAKDKVFGYNPKTKSYQLKEVGGEWAKDQILLSTQIPNEDVRDLLFLDYLHAAKEVAAKIKILLENVKTNS